MAGDGGTSRLRNAAIVSFVVSMAIILVGGYYALDKVPPMPARVVADGKEMFSLESIRSGQDVYQRYGLMDQVNRDKPGRTLVCPGGGFTGWF